jgi:hypothetical protein
MEKIKKSSVGFKWCHAHPYKLAMAASALVLVSSYMRFWDNWLILGLTVFMAGIVIWAAFFVAGKKVITVILTAAFVTNSGVSLDLKTKPEMTQQTQRFEKLHDANLGLEPPTAETPVAGVAVVAVVVRCVAVGVVVYCVYRIIDFCQRKLPKDKETNAPPEIELNLDGNGTADDEYGASFNYAAFEYCNLAKRDVLEDRPAVTTTLMITPGDPPSILMNISLGPEASQDWDGFQKETESHGLEVKRLGDGSEYFERNRFPVSSEDVPIVFDPYTMTVTHGAGGQLIVVSRSTDLENWTDLIVVDTDGPFGVEDTTDGKQMFYRVILGEVRSE